MMGSTFSPSRLYKDLTTPLHVPDLRQEKLSLTPASGTMRSHFQEAHTRQARSNLLQKFTSGPNVCQGGAMPWLRYSFIPHHQPKKQSDRKPQALWAAVYPEA